MLHFDAHANLKAWDGPTRPELETPSRFFRQVRPSQRHVVYMRRIQEAFRLHLRDGVQRGRPGDWLVIDRQQIPVQIILDEDQGAAWVPMPG